MNVFYVNAGVLSPPPNPVKSERAIFCPSTPPSHSLLSALPSVIACHADYGRIDEIDYSPDVRPPSVLFYGVSCVDKITYVKSFESDAKVRSSGVRREVTSRAPPFSLPSLSLSRR